MAPSNRTHSHKESAVPLAIVLEGVPEKWQMNVLQILGCPISAKVKLHGYGTIDAAAFLLSQDQARHLATQITEILGPEKENEVQAFFGARESS